MKWEPILAMVVLFGLAVWIVLSPSRPASMPTVRDGAQLLEVRVGKSRGLLEVVEQTDAAPKTRDFRLLWRDGTASAIFDERELARRFGENALARVVEGAAHPVLRLFSITSWGGLIWVALGFLGQALFFARMALQWIVSEREKRSIVPRSFWILSLGGGVLLFTYFLWRRDIVGILGQTTGIVIYARNLRLISKERRRMERTQ